MKERTYKILYAEGKKKMILKMGWRKNMIFDVIYRVIDPWGWIPFIHQQDLGFQNLDPDLFKKLVVKSKSINNSDLN